MRWPEGWREVTLAEIVESAQSGFAQRPGEEDEGTTPQIRTHNVTPEGRISLEGIKHVTVAEGDLVRYRLQPGDVIFNNTNSEEWVGKTAIFDRDGGDFVYSNHMTRIRVRSSLVSPTFLALYLHFLWDSGYSRNRSKRWVSQASIGAPTLLKFKVPLPPLPEQQGIVDTLQEVDSIVVAKGRASRRFDDLIQGYYRQQFGRYFAADGLVNPVRIGERIDSAQYGVSEAMDEEGSHAVLRMNSISPTGWLDLSDLKYANLSERDIRATELRNGDLLFNRTNSRELVGKCAIWRGVPGPFSFASYLVRLRLKEGLLPEFLWSTLNSAYGKYRLLNAAKQAVSMANVSPTDLARIPIPLPPLEEQERFACFVREVELQREGVINASAGYSRLLRALVQEAFSGRLTARWREVHSVDLGSTARERDEDMGLLARKRDLDVQFSEHAPPERNTGFSRPRRQGLVAQLSIFQHAVWDTLRRDWRGAVLVDDPTVFEDFCTNPKTAWRLDGFDAAPAEVRRALEQLAAMGLIRKMSLPRDDPNTGRTEYHTAFRSLFKDEQGNRAEEDVALLDADRVRKELKRRQQEVR